MTLCNVVIYDKYIHVIQISHTCFLAYSSQDLQNFAVKRNLKLSFCYVNKVTFGNSPKDGAWLPGKLTL